MAKSTCSVEGCPHPNHARGWCQRHYKRWRKWGDPLKVRLSPEEKFWRKVDIRGPDECWPWTAGGNMADGGYGWFRPEGVGWLAHRFAYELLVGPIPEGLTIDHTCHNRDLSCVGGRACPHRRCCNPAHLEAVPHAVNVARGRGGGHLAVRTHCAYGHPLKGDNLAWRSDGHGRRCRACQREWRRRYNAKQRPA